ncbi:MAG: class II glutamine amidotransferase [Myxococcota bacterium]
MCRFTLYMGEPIRLSSLLIEPEHSLIRQSSHSQEREEPLNGDGFGVGWYAADPRLEPAVFRSITPAWNNRNLANLARVVSSGCILAHVRAATQSSGVNEANCHPFRFRSHLFMHNGDVGNFRQVRRPMLASVCDEAFDNVYGSTDSEHVFALVIDEMLRAPAWIDCGERLARALEGAIARVVEIVEKHGQNEPCYLNCALSDGQNAVVTRYSNDPDAPPESLYYYSGGIYPSLEGRVARSVLVSSERLTADPAWREIPPNHMVIIRAGHEPELAAIAVAGAVVPG